MSSLNLRNISKSYGDQEILKKINLDINESEFLVLVGPSGCGKSTTLRLIAGLESPNEGEILIENKIVNNIDPSKRDIAMVFQNYALYPQMTVKENMAFGLRIRNFSDEDVDKKVLEAAGILKIDNLLERRPKELSGGQRQRVALGRAIVRKPKVFLFDEPLSNLDAKLRQEMRVEIKRLHQMLDTTMIYVTHDQVEAMTMGDRIVVMNNGVIEQVDSPEDTYTRPTNIFTSTFIGAPQINLFKGELKKEDAEWSFTSNGLTLYIEDKHYQYSKLRNGDVVFGIRPEDIHGEISPELQDERNIINADVEFLEYLGSETNLHLSSGPNRFSAKFNKKIDTDLSQTKVAFDINKGHFFDAENEDIL
tara:strand:- start:384 stop:1475 length:1092 start_codon:yes stop_codon:yes gene_type:complete